jgi:hypothetical protein
MGWARNRGRQKQNKKHFYSLKRVSLVLSADGKTIILEHFDRPARINASHY